MKHDALKAGESITFTIRVTADVTDLVLLLRVDVDNDTPELNENNNTVTIDFGQAPEPEPTCVDGETRPADDGCNDCVCGVGEWACTEMACDPVDDDSSSSSSGGMTTSQMVRVVLGVLSLIAGVFLITLLIRVRDQEDEGKFE